MRFGFDIDDTLIQLRQHAFTLYNQELGQNFGQDIFEQICRVEIHEPFGLTSEEGSAMWQRMNEQVYFTDCPSYEQAKELLWQLTEAGHDIYYITARPESSCLRTRQWMIDNGYPVKEGHFYCGMQDHEKLAIIEELDLDVYVDDKPKILHSLKDLRTIAVLRDQPYNRDESFERITHWSQFMRYVTVDVK